MFNKTNKITNKGNKAVRALGKSNTRKNNKVAKGIFLKSTTPPEISILSDQIDSELNSNSNSDTNSMIDSYSPSINEKLITLNSLEREPLVKCNTTNAFLNKEPLEISINSKCYPYHSKKAKDFLLKNLAANKHINPEKIVTPIQSLGNCWFNTMFVTLFVSDKGRKFFHFFRQLMIEGVRANKKPIPDALKNGFALLNYAIDACLTGNQFAYKMDTNIIIKNIYDNIPLNTKNNLPYITNIKDAGNPIRYYGSLMYYLRENSIQLAFISSCTSDWKKQLTKALEPLANNDKNINEPHIIILEFFDDASKSTTNKLTKFTLPNKTKYMLDSCIIRNTKGHHFCSLLTCEKKEYAYDGMSFHRLVRLSWKKCLNQDFIWRFEGSTDNNNVPLGWNFKSGYQMLVYYRVN
jgi:hypothetical protein